MRGARVWSLIFLLTLLFSVRMRLAESRCKRLRSGDPDQSSRSRMPASYERWRAVSGGSSMTRLSRLSPRVPTRVTKSARASLFDGSGGFNCGLIVFAIGSAKSDLLRRLP
eukprot:1195166-Prorocentrum_minimum.AAC.2